MFLSIVIPAYNEGNVIKKSVELINRYFINKFSFEIIVINDGSNDDTNSILHQLKIKTDRDVYFLRSKIDRLSNQFEVIKTDKFLFKNKSNNLDFRVKPTFNNTKKFSSWILKNKIQKPNFFDGQRVHLIIDKMLLSSKKRKKIYIN